VTNIIAPFGLQDLERREGGSPTYGLTKVSISSSDATPIFSGDLVQLLNSAVASGGFGEYITQGSSGLTSPNTSWRGVFKGCEFLNTAVGRVVWSPFWPATGASSQADPIAYITDDPSLLYIAQATSAAVIGSSNVGNNISITATSSLGNTITGQSVIALTSSNIGTTASSGSSFPFRIRDFYSNFAPGLLPNQPVTAAVAAAQLGFVNGTDNTNPGQIIVVEPNNFTNKQLFNQ
jgi:hypothetical protein